MLDSYKAFSEKWIFKICMKYVFDMNEPAPHDSDAIKELQSRLQILENENRLLRERLTEAGISYADIVSEHNNNNDDDDEFSTEPYDPNQGARIKRFEITDKIASDFFMMFCRGRKDVYELRYANPRTGKTGYYTQCFNRWDRNCHIQKKDPSLGFSTMILWELFHAGYR